MPTAEQLANLPMVTDGDGSTVEDNDDDGSTTTSWPDGDEDWTLLNRIDYINMQPDQCVDIGNYPLAEILSNIESDLNTITAAAHAAINDARNAGFPVVVKAGAARPPRDKRGAAQWLSQTIL